ncbi:MAG: class I SAM-dependent methyltransferase [Planctomycetota bacterium]
MAVPLEETACPLCGTHAPRRLFPVRDLWLDAPEIYGVVECGSCGHVYLNPRPHRNEIGALYPPVYYKTARTDDEIRSTWNSPLNRQKASYTTLRPSALCFDIGAYWGDFLYYMQRHEWRVQGCELSPHPRNIFGLDIRRGMLEEASLPAQSVDLLTAWAVIEHVYDPMAMAREAFRILRPGGEFLFTCPNFAGLPARYMQQDDIPRHVQFFTPASVRFLAERAGFRVDRIWFDDKLFQMSSRGLVEYTLRKAHGRSFVRFRREKRSRAEIERRASLSALQKFREAGVFWSTVRALDHILAPLLDRLAMWRGTYGIMTVRLKKPDEKE